MSGRVRALGVGCWVLGVGCFPFSVLQQSLHVNHIQPSAEFETDLLQVSNFLTREPVVQSDAGGLVGVNSSDDRFVADHTGAINEVLKQERADAASMMFVMNVNRVLDGSAVGRTGMIR